MPRDDPHYIPGDNWLIDDRTGFKIRARDARKEWNGLVVHQRNFEERHPQDFVKGIPEDQSVEEPRDRSPESYIGPIYIPITGDTLPGGNVITVEHTSGVADGDSCGVFLDDGNVHRTTVSGVPTGTTITIADPVPSKVSGSITVSRQFVRY